METAPPTQLASTGDIAEAADQARQAGRLGIDTEFMSEGRYRALLCLVQIAVDDPEQENGSHTILVDTLHEVGATPPARLLAEPEIEIVLHAGRQDVPILLRVWQTDINNI